MKTNSQPVTQREVTYSPTSTITSATDPSSRIVYVNDDFLKVSGYLQSELLSQPHNIVRHPDMPKAAFADLWQSIKSGKPWMGIVKNRCKNGDHYWVDAFVTPRFDKGNIIGFESVRVQPDRAAVERAENVYAKLNSGTSPTSWFDRLSLPARLNLGLVVSLASIIGLAAALGWVAPGKGIGLFVGILAVAGFWMWLMLRPLARAASQARRVVDNPIMQQVYTDDGTEVGQLLFALKMMKAKSRTIIRRLIQATEPLAGKANSTYQAIAAVSSAMNQQQAEIDQVGAAIHQMSASVGEVARNASSAAISANDVSRQSLQTLATVNETLDMMSNVTAAVQQAEAVIQVLSEHSRRIGGVLDVIKGIAEQTNLLALNAAIEAARAGEQGRGFAVVADEVRTLAARTQQSTEEIQNMIGGLQSGVGNAVKEMAAVREMAAQGAEHGKNSSQLLQDTAKSVEAINQLIVQIAAATDQQQTVAEDISRAVEAIGNLARSTTEHASLASENSGSVSALSKELDMMVEQFEDPST